MEVTINTVNENLNKLMLEVARLREHLEDSYMTEDDWDSIEKAKEDQKNGRTISLEKLKKELNV